MSLNTHPGQSLVFRFFLDSKRGILRMLPVLLWATLMASCSNARTLSVPSSTPVATSTRVQLGPTNTATITSTPAPTAQPTPTLRPIDPISESDWKRGATNPSVQVLVYSDFQCPYCADLFGVLEEILARHPDDFQLVFRHFPLVSIHDKAFAAAQAAEAAGAQGQFWSMHDLLFSRRAEWVGLPAADFPAWILEQARTLDLDDVRFEEELLEGKYAPVVAQAYEHAVQSGIPGTPFIFFNGRWFRLSPTLINMEAAVRLELLGQHQFTSAPDLALEPGNLYFARLELEQGTVVIQLLPQYAPQAAANFIFLAQSGWFENMPIYGVIPGQLVETGDPSGTGFGGPGYTIPDEIHADLKFDQAGIVAMSSSGPGTNGSRFFISLSALPDLDGSRTIFGRVTQGLEILQDLPARDPLEDLLNPPAGVVEHVEIEIR
jgi:cyclophilin family peptidyl-prolyl cis-trans isomerase/protein-disulfide isomerase